MQMQTPSQSLSSPFTNEQEDEIAEFFEEHKYFYDMVEWGYNNKWKREHLPLELAQRLGFTSGKYSFNFSLISSRVHEYHGVFF